MTSLWPLPPREEMLPEEWETAPEECRTYGRWQASRALELLTGHQVGVLPITIRPTRRTDVRTANVDFYPGDPAYGMYPLLWDGDWHNGPCAPGSACEVALPEPVGRIDKVTVGTTELIEGTDYRIDNGNLLVWTGAGDCPFPTTQRIDASEDDDGVMSVTFVNSFLPDEAGAIVALIFAWEFVLACMGQNCRLPANVENIVRQGVTFNIAPGHWPGGRTGIPEVDSYLAVHNPNARLNRPVVYSLDMPEPRTFGG